MKVNVNKAIIWSAVVLVFMGYWGLFFMKKEKQHPYPATWNLEQWKVASYYDFYRVPDLYYNELAYLVEPMTKILPIQKSRDIVCYLDRLEKVKKVIKIRGWCFSEMNTSEEICLYFMNAQDTLMFPVVRQVRPDVQQQKNLSKKELGIMANIHISHFNPEKYDLYMGMINDSSVEVRFYTSVHF